MAWVNVRITKQLVCGHKKNKTCVEIIGDHNIFIQ